AFRQAEAGGREHRAADFRPRGQAAVRRSRLRICPGPRRRRQDPALEREVRPDSRGHARLWLAESEKSTEKKEAEPAGGSAILVGRAVQAVASGGAGETLQQRAAAVAPTGVLVEDIARGEPASRSRTQTTDGRGAC